MKVEEWNGYKIRFVEKDGEWWAVAIDICSALGLKQVTRALKGLSGVQQCDLTISNLTSSKARKTQKVNIINEKSIYRLAFKSRKPEAEAFQDWVFDVIKNLRQSIGLEGFQVFRLLDKEHQKQAMSKLSHSLKKPVRIDFIKANTIANKTVSDKYGFPKMVKKADMSPDMLSDRQGILDSTIELMAVNDKYNLNLSVSEKVHEIVLDKHHTA